MLMITESLNHDSKYFKGEWKQWVYNAFNNMDLSSDEAISLLKKFKEKLDLQLISQEEYDKKKAELLKYIKWWTCVVIF